ncbi:hypothetical protein [Streptomyces collinus]|uniref:hypothetical protein n=1 Tax=Streptomyces collinus TaxID=42684 RepID=UPI003675905E
MTDSTTSTQSGTAPFPHGSAPSPSEVRAERRRLIESIRALRRLLGKRRAFELADQRRLNGEARDRDRVETAHGKSLRRIDARRSRQESALIRRLGGLDGKRESQEKRALAVLRRESIERALGSTYLTAAQVNGIGDGLIRDLAAQGIRTAADFKRVSWGKAPNGKGGEVLYIHRTGGGKVHINGIGEHRGRPLLAWRDAAAARAEARAPHQLPPDERHRLAEIIEAERKRFQAELAEVPKAAEAARAESERAHAAALGQLATDHAEAAERAAERRAEFDVLGERLLGLQAQLSAHMAQYGDAGRRVRRAEVRALRALPDVPPSPGLPSPRTPSEATPTTGGGTRPVISLTKTADPTPPKPVHGSRDVREVHEVGEVGEGGEVRGVRAGIGWLLPILYFGLTAVVGVGELGDNTAHLWVRFASRLFAFAATVELLRLWVPRRRRRTARPMPRGIGFQTVGVFLALTAVGMFEDEKADVFAAACAASILSALLLLAGTGLRLPHTTQTVSTTTPPF